MKGITIALGLVLLLMGIVFAQETYIKKDNLTMTIKSQLTPAYKEEDVTLKDLLSRKANILAEIQRLDKEHVDNRKVKLDELTKVENLIVQAKTLGIVEVTP